MIDAAQSTFVSLRRRYRHAQAVKRVRAASRSAHDRGQRVVHMLHVGKTGGTAVQAALTGTAVQAALTATPPPASLRLLLHGHGISLGEIPGEDEVFLFLREPVARFVSGFEMRRREGRPRHYRPWTNDERVAFSRFDSAESLALALGSDEKETRMKAERAMRGIYHVKSHLADWLVSDELVRERSGRLMFVGWQERLEADFGRLVALLDLAPTTRLPADAYEANRASPDEDTQRLSEEATHNMRAWYAADYYLIALLTELRLTSPPDEVSLALSQRGR
jgi:hypothetical protein